MKYKLSARSIRRLKDVDPRLIRIVHLAIERTPVDFGVAWMGGIRTDEEQNQLYKDKVSQKDGYIRISKHQFGEAVDLNVFVEGKYVDNKEMLCIVAGVMFACAGALGYTIRWGLMWNQSGDIRDNTFNDQYHFEII